MNDQTKTIKQWLGTGSINVFGLPFAGKDTQGEVLAELFDGVMISSGDILRHSKDNPRLQKLLAAGEIIPSDLFGEIVLPYFSRQELAGKPLILSEVGRMEGEQQAVMQAADDTGHPIKATVLLGLPEDEVFSRFEAAKQINDRGDRADDRREVLQTRLDNYRAKVTPVLDWYREKGLLIEIDGTLSREDVSKEIIKELLIRAS